jgi:Cu/Ag efflux pump CusA
VATSRRATSRSSATRRQRQARPAARGREGRRRQHGPGHQRRRPGAEGAQAGLPGITFDASIFRQADFIHQAIDNLTLALLLGCLLVIGVLIAFLFEWRTALISLLAIPLSLMAAMLVLYLRGETINTMILAGLVIAVGVVVDDAIIDVENIWRRLRQRGDKTGRLAPRVILQASLEVRSAIWYATLINVLAVVPVFFLQSVTGSFFEPLAFSYALAILASMVVALTVTPALSLILLSKTASAATPRSCAG